MAPHFAVVDGRVPRRAFVSVTPPDGSACYEALAASLNEGAMTLPSPPAFTNVSGTCAPKQ